MAYEYDPFEKLEERRIKREQERMAMAKRTVELNAEGERDATTLRVLAEMYPDRAPSAKLTPRPKDFSDRLPLPSAPVPEEKMNLGQELAIKHVVLNIVRDANPQGVTSQQIGARAAVKYRMQINKNTLGVSLGRHSRAGRIKCVSKRWYYIPEHAHAANGHAGAQVEKRAESEGGTA